MVIFINGSLGVGKTSISNYLLWCCPRSVLLEGDALCNTNPFEPYDQVRIQNLTEIIQYMVIKYRKIGYETFIIDNIFEKELEIEGMNKLLESVDPDIHHYLLICDSSQRERQILMRKRENHMWELKRSSELEDLLLREFSGRECIKTIDASGKTKAEVGELILSDIREKKT